MLYPITKRFTSYCMGFLLPCKEPKCSKALCFAGLTTKRGGKKTTKKHNTIVYGYNKMSYNGGLYYADGHVI